MVVKTIVQDSTDIKRVKKTPPAPALKLCKTDGCDRQVRNGASYCITHGGGNTCQQTGCSTSARHGSVYCIAHGGGRRCQEPGCTKSAVGSTDFCKAHGGGRRCQFPGCDSAARPGQPQMCMKHGGGKRCALATCERSAAARSDYCSEHRHLDGGAPADKKRVTQKGHKKAGGMEKDARDSYHLIARDSTRPSFTATDITVAPLNYFLKDFRNAEDLGPPLLFTIGENTRVPSPCDTPQEIHEESEPEEEEEDVPMYTHPLARDNVIGCDRHVSLGKTCMVAGCQKRVRTASFYCINHGGGQRCLVESCAASARDGFLYCIRHGGGHRCIESDCPRSAVGKTVFCKKHGGGRRCLHPGCHAPARSGGKVQMCQKHGGGKRCSRDECERMAIPRSNFCKTHHQIEMVLNHNAAQERFEQPLLDGEYCNITRPTSRPPSTPMKMSAAPSLWKPLPMTDSEKKSYDRMCNYNRAAGNAVETSFAVKPVPLEPECQESMLDDLVILHIP